VCTDGRFLKAEGLPLSVVRACGPVDGDTYDVRLQIGTVEDRRAAIYRIKFGDEKMQKQLSAVTLADDRQPVSCSGSWTVWSRSPPNEVATAGRRIPKRFEDPVGDVGQPRHPDTC
jgi:hypothetical protein